MYMPQALYYARLGLYRQLEAPGPGGPDTLLLVSACQELMRQVGGHCWGLPARGAVFWCRC